MAGIGIWQLIIILVIVLLLFGSKQLKNLGGDLGGAIKGFKGVMKAGEDKPKTASENHRSVEDDSAEKGKNPRHYNCF
ncbi:MAG: twin-arginine translocase subunit TatA [Piscirickettsiaceae bacterium]|nr:MAG: twin-arginine translocase subunit TatA [Piscirickettsiaceae bacterium]